MSTPRQGKLGTLDSEASSGERSAQGQEVSKMRPLEERALGPHQAATSARASFLA